MSIIYQETKSAQIKHVFWQKYNHFTKAFQPSTKISISKMELQRGFNKYKSRKLYQCYMSISIITDLEANIEEIHQEAENIGVKMNNDKIK